MKADEHECTEKDTLLNIQLKQAAIGADITYIKQKIDNGMSSTIKNTNDTLRELTPVIAHHANIVRRIEDIGWLISRWLIVVTLGTLSGLVVWAIGKGFLPK